MDRTTPQQTFGQLIRRYRRRAGLTQEELAERAELSPRGLVYLERGERHPQPGTVRRLADALGLSEEERSAFASLIGQDAVTGDTAPGVASSATVEVSSQSALPLQPTPFIGREREVTAVMALLGREAVRLLTLTGPGGTGKTRLAVQVAAEVRDTFPDGAFFVSLAPLGDPGLVASAIATTLGVKETAGQPLIETLKASLGTKQLLLVLDNFEHLLPAAPLVGELLAACPHLVVLVTSRSYLHLAAEHEYLVPGMTLPGEQHRSHLAVLSRVDAVAFFLERARAIKPDFALTEENAPAIVEICHRLDGLPLALELAAARIRLFPPQALLARLEHRLNLLTGGAKDRPSRQQTLRGTIDWSYSLLSEEEQTLFARLSVFAGGCTFEAAEAVCNSEGEPDLLAGMTSLVEQSLLRQEGEEEPRFLMLETIREYAHEKLEASDQADRIRLQHADYFLEMASQAEPELFEEQQDKWAARLEMEIDNFRAILTFTVQRGEMERAAQLGSNLWRFWMVRGHISEGRTWLEQVLATDRIAPLTRARAFLGAGALAIYVDDIETVRLRLQECLPMLRELDDQRGAALCSCFLGFAMHFGGEPGGAKLLFEEALGVSRALNFKFGIALTTMGLGVQAVENDNDLEEAMKLMGDALRLFRELGDAWGVAATRANIALVSLRQRDRAKARVILHESISAFEEMRDYRSLMLCASSLAMEAVYDGDLDVARIYAEQSTSYSREMSSKGSLSSSLCTLGIVALEQGNYVGALVSLRESLELGRHHGDTERTVDTLEAVAGVFGRQGKANEAARLYGAVVALRATSGGDRPPEERLRCERHLSAARVRLTDADWNTAWDDGQAMSLEQAVVYALEEAADDRVTEKGLQL